MTIKGGRLIDVPDPKLVTRAKLEAAKRPYDGTSSPATQLLIQRCTHYHAPTKALLIYTRDVGHHSSGWWKNPDYERCLHLSISFVTVDRDQRFWPMPFNRRKAEQWTRAFFGDDTRLCWIEPPHTFEGKARGVHHYRLFCDPSWTPIKPRGEVYSRDWTPAGWLSWSDLHGEAEG